jgi:hypothetical protein
VGRDARRGGRACGRPSRAPLPPRPPPAVSCPVRRRPEPRTGQARPRRAEEGPGPGPAPEPGLSPRDRSRPPAGARPAAPGRDGRHSSLEPLEERPPLAGTAPGFRGTARAARAYSR